MIVPIKHVTTPLIAGCLCAATGLAVSGTSWGNNAGVFPPVVSEGHRSMQYRIAIDPHLGAWGSRLHYHQSLNGNVMLRGVIYGSESGLGNFTFDFALAALFWDLGDDSEKLRHVFRFDARV